jgi:hypothetical protein
MLRMFQNAKRLISVCLATLLIVVSTITIFPSTASADNNLIQNNLGNNGDFVLIKCTSDRGNIFSFVVGATTGIFAGSGVTLMATGNTAILATAGTAIGQTAVTALAGLGAAATTALSTPVLVPVAATVAGAYVVSQIVNKDNHSQNAN